MDDDDEVQTGLNISEDIVPTRPVVSSSIVSESFNGLLNPPLKLQTNQTQCGGQLWPAGMVLADYMIREKLGYLNGKTMFVILLELGAGSGLTGLAVALGLQQKRPESSSNTEIYLTDGLPALIPLLNQNIDLNDLMQARTRLLVQAEYFSWGQSPPPASLPKPDVILAADCAYLEETFPLLVQSLRDTMGPDTVLWFCYKKRRKRDKDCLKMIGKVFNVEVIKGAWEQESVFLYEIRRRG